MTRSWQYVCLGKRGGLLRENCLVRYSPKVSIQGKTSAPAITVNLHQCYLGVRSCILPPSDADTIAIIALGFSRSELQTPGKLVTGFPVKSC
jgi:hypothetical protein